MTFSAVSGIQANSGGRWAARAGWAMTALPVVFLLFDGAAKVMRVEPVMEACERLGIPGRVVPGLGAVLVAGTLLYAWPRTAPLGAIVLTGYLGGAIWTHVWLGDPAFPVVFPAFVAALIWGGIYLREPRLREIIPWRR